MTPERCAAITRDRFESWTGVLRACQATPAFCLAIRHDPQSPGMVIVQVEDFTTGEIITLLRETAGKLAEQEGGVG